MEPEVKETEKSDGVLRIVSGHTKSIDSKTRTVRAVLSSETVDRYGDVVLASSFNNKKNFDNYFNTNAIVLWAHGRDSNFGMKPVGNVKNPSFDGTDTGGEKAFEGDVIFTDAFQGAEDIWRLYEKEVLRAFSVGFRPITIKREPDKPGQTGITFIENDLLENSAVPIPANPKALRKAFIDGGISEEFLVRTFFPIRDHLVRNTDIFVPTNWHYKDSINDMVSMASEFDQEKLALPSQFARKRDTLAPVKVHTDQYECVNCQYKSLVTFTDWPVKEFAGMKFNDVTCSHCKTTTEQCLQAMDLLLASKKS